MGFVPFPIKGLTDSLSSHGWQSQARGDQETDRSLSEDVPPLFIRSVPFWGGVLGFTEITTPIIKTMNACRRI